MSSTLYVDLRYLQQHADRIRGIGQHLTALLRTRAQSEFKNWKTIGLIDPRSPKLPDSAISLVDELSGCLNPCCDSRQSAFIDGTAMMHDTRFGIRFLSDPQFVTAAVVYDFIPLDWPGYLPSVYSRIDYFARLARLRTFDHFLPISEYTASRTSQLLGVSRSKIRVTGAAVRHSLYELSERLNVEGPPGKRNDAYFFMVVGPDERKNPRVAVEALLRVNQRASRRVLLKIAGYLLPSDQAILRELATDSEGRSFLEFCPDVPDGELARLFAGAVATIVPSHIEGFSLPVVEASVCGCPVIASSCVAHLELLGSSEALFPSNDPVALAKKLELLLSNSLWRTSLVSSQAHLGPRFHERAVGRRFWDAMENAVHARASITKTRPKTPRLAFMSPMSDDEPQAAFYTAMTMREGAGLFHSELYAASPGSQTGGGNFPESRPLSVAPLLSDRYYGVVSVLGNSQSFSRIFDFFETYGGPCILHDARLTQIYYQRLGQARFADFANQIMGRHVSVDEISAWIRDEQPASLFLERVIARASPLIVHTPTQQALIERRYGISPHVLTSCPEQLFTAEDLSVRARKAARERLGIPTSVFALSSFGYPARSRGMDTCILTVELLRSWNIPAEIYFVNNSSFDTRDMSHIAELYEIPKYVHGDASLWNRKAYRDFLIASDAAIQVRNYSFGSPSTDLSNCVSAGLTCVTTDDLARSCQAPPFAFTVTDHFSHLHVAEELAVIYESSRDRESTEPARRDYLETHNFTYYTRRLAEILEIK